MNGGSRCRRQERRGEDAADGGAAEESLSHAGIIPPKAVRALPMSPEP